MNNIEQRVKKVISQQLDVEESQVKNESSFVEDLGADSLDTVELIMELENEFNISIEESEAGNIQTVSDVIKFIEAKQA